jgi:hypothetical protein
MKYTAPTHYQPFETISLDDVKPGMRLEIHMRTGTHAGKEFYFDVARIYTDSLYNTAGLMIYKRDIVKGTAEIRNRDAQPSPLMVKGEGAPQYTMFDLPKDTQLALL